MKGIGFGNVMIVNAYMRNVSCIAAGHVAIHASAVTPDGGREAASLVFALFGFGLMATHAGLVKPVLVSLFDTHMRIVAVDTGEIDVCVVLVEVAFV